MDNIYSLYEKEQLENMFDRFPKVGQKFIASDSGETYTIAEYEIDEIKVNVTSFIGNGGVHYYGSIRYHPVVVTTEESHYVMGYLGGLEITTDLEIRLERFVIQEDLDKRYENWESYHVGSTTERYSTIEALAYDIEVLLVKYFPKNILIEYDGNENHTVKSVLKLRNIILKDWEPYDEK